MFAGIIYVLFIAFGFFVIKSIINYHKEYDQLLYSKDYNVREYAIKEREMMKKGAKPVVIYYLILIVSLIIIFLINYLN